jgi:hypothetical protein
MYFKNNGMAIALNTMVSSNTKARLTALISMSSINAIPKSNTPWKAIILIYVSNRWAIPR